MARGDVFVNARARIGGTILAETQLPRKTIMTPAYTPRVQIPLDLRVLTERLYIRRPPEMVCYELPNLERVTSTRLRKVQQRTISGESLDPTFERFTHETAAIVDPFSEYFTVRRQAGKSPDGNPVYVRDRIASLTSFPGEVARLFQDDAWDLKLWTQIIEGKYHLALIDWYFVYQSPIRPLIFIPPVNVVDGNSSLAVALELNRAAAAAFPPGEEPTVPAMYLPLYSSVFRSAPFMDSLFKAVAPFATDQRILILKILWYRNLNESSVMRAQLARFLNRLDGLKRQVHDTALIFVLEAQEQGLALLGNGVDAYAESLTGFEYFPQSRRPVPASVKEKKAIELDLEDNDGWWLNPKTRVMAPSTYQDITANCGCPACRKSGKDEGIDLAVRRRAHQYNIRTMEVDLLRDAVERGDSEFIRRVLGSGDNKNLLDLLAQE